MSKHDSSDVKAIAPVNAVPITEPLQFVIDTFLKPTGGIKNPSFALIRLLEDYLGLSLLIAIIDYIQKNQIQGQTAEPVTFLFNAILASSENIRFIEVTFKILYMSGGMAEQWHIYFAAIQKRIQELRTLNTVLDNEFLAQLMPPAQCIQNCMKDNTDYRNNFILANEFKLVFSAKNHRKHCEIPDLSESDSALSLHARQSLAERLIDKRTTNIHQLVPAHSYYPRVWPKWTYVIANIGFVVSDRVQQKGGFHNRIFKTMPISRDHLTLDGDNEANLHAEEVLYRRLNDKIFLISLLKRFKEFCGIKSAGHKIYLMVLDLHSTYDMCVSCCKSTNQFTASSMNHIKACLAEEKFSLPKKRELQMVVRYSSDIPYHYDNKGEKGQGTRQLATLREESPRVSSTVQVKTFLAFPGLCLHGTSRWHNFWSADQRARQRQPVRLESWTAFSSASGIAHLSDADRRFDYTNCGVVEVDDPRTDEDSVAQGIAGLNLAAH